MRLLYKFFLSGFSSEECRLVINSLKTHVAINLSGDNTYRKGTLRTDIIYKFLTTSRHVEKWLQSVEDSALLMREQKVPSELLMVIGGNGAGKSHIKEYLLATFRMFPDLFSFEIELASELSNTLKTSSTVDNIMSLILLQTSPYLDKLFESIGKNRTNEEVEMILAGNGLDNEFIQKLIEYWEFRRNHLGTYQPLENILSRNGNRLFLLIMKLYKKFLGINGIYLFIDEFEELSLLTAERQERFIESFRAIYDALAASLIYEDLPSFKMIVLCTISIWNDIHDKPHFRALETRVTPFEIIPLVEDEVTMMAEKLYALFWKAGLLASRVNIDFAKVHNYVIKKASEEGEPLTPRYVIAQLIYIIENPDEYNRLLLMQQLKSQQQTKE